MLEVVYLDITSWRGVSIGAVHFYGTLKALKDGEIQELELKRLLSDADAKMLNEQRRENALFDAVGEIRYKAGEEVNRWDAPDDIRKRASEVWQVFNPAGDVLIESFIASCDPGRCLAGPPDIKDRINALWERAKSIGYYDGGHEEEMDAIHKEYYFNVLGH